MKNNLKVLFIQLCVLAIGCFIGEAVFGLPKWLGLVIAGLMFYLVFFIIQIKGAMSNIKDEVSSDGIAGARICGVFISAILLAFILGIYVYQAANIAMTIAGVVLLILQRRKIKVFSLRIAGKIIFGWCILVLHLLFVVFFLYLRVWILHHARSFVVFTGLSVS